MLSLPAFSGPGTPPIIAIVDFRMLGTAGGEIRDWRRVYGLSGFNQTVPQVNGELTDFLVLFAFNPLNDGTHNLYFPLNIHLRGRLWNGSIPSCIRPLPLGAGGDIKNQAGRSSPDQVVFFEQLRNC